MTTVLETPETSEFTPAPPARFRRRRRSSGGAHTEVKASRWWLLGAFVLAMAAVIPQAFGRQFVNTKLDLITSPTTLLSHLLNLWDPNGWFGYLQDQYQGYAFPVAPFFALGHYLAVPPWVTERVWMAILITGAFWGVVRLTEALDIGSLPTRLVAGLAFALWPTFTVLIGINAAAIAPGILLPWVLVPLVKGCKGGSPLRAAALSGLAVLLIGGVNAADTIDILIMPALFLLTRQRSARRRSLMSWWVICIGLAVLWWLIPLLFLGKYGFNFLPYTEQSAVTTGTMSAAASLQGIGDWVSYLKVGGINWDPSGAALASIPLALFGSALAAGVGLFGLARRDIRERRFLLVVLAVAAGLTMAGYWGQLGGPFGGILRPLLNGGLQPFRNVYKFEPLLALPLTIGIAHALHVLRPRLRNKGSIIIVSLLAVGTLVSLASPYLMGRASTPNSFVAVPKYWYQTADYLAKHAPRTTALVLPDAAHGYYTWGWSIDEPLEAINKSPWIDREVAPYSGAGSTRVIDAIDQAFRTGLPQPGLAALLHRSGISYVVVQDDSEWQLSDSPSPSTVHNVLNLAHMSVSASFGPTIKTTTGNNPTLSLAPGGFTVRFPAVQIFKVPGSSSPLATYATATAALVSGGPEADFQLFNQGILKQDQAVILAGDRVGGTYTGPLWAVTDTLRRESYQFGLVNDNYSYTLAANQKVPPGSGRPDGPQPPRQLLPFSGQQHQTVEQFTGATSVDASSYGSWVLDLPEYNPANVFDRDSSTGWAAGSAGGSVGQWIGIHFLKPRQLRGTHIKLLASSHRPVATEVQVSTNRGSVISHLTPNSTSQVLRVPAGKASWMKVTFTKVTHQVTAGADAGIQEISIPGLHVQPYLKPPQEDVGKGAKKTVFSFASAQVDPTAILREAPEPVLARTFSTTKATRMTVTGTAIPIRGTALNNLLGTSALQVSASSTFDDIPTLRPENLFDSQISTDWIAGFRHATLKLSWPKPAVLNQVTVVFAQKTLAAKPEEILLKTPFGNRLLHVNTKGGAAIIKFPALDTDQLEISFPKVIHLESANGLGGESPVPVGLAGLQFPALSQYNITAEVPVSHFGRLCGLGPPVTIDGHVYATSLTGNYQKLYFLQPLKLSVCGKPKLAAGDHHVIAEPSTAAYAPFTVTALTLSSAGPSAPSTPSPRTATTLTWGPESRTVRMSSGASTYLELHQNYNVGWIATVNGKKLQAITLDGWQQGYIVPAGSGEVVHLKFKPENLYLGGLIVGALGVLILGLLMVFGFRRASRVGGWGAKDPAVLAWNKTIPSWALLVLSALVIFTIGGPIALVVVPLFVVARRWPQALPWVAVTGMVAVGVLSAVNPGNGALSHLGSFGPWAQTAAVISVAAVLIPVRSHLQRRPRRTTLNKSDSAKAEEDPLASVSAEPGVNS
jgi:arabinofuranan 3-O-arabinosyltransferase